MKEQLRGAFTVKSEEDRALLAGLISLCQRCRILQFTAFVKTMKNFRKLIWNTIDHRLGSGCAEVVDTRLAALATRV